MLCRACTAKVGDINLSQNQRQPSGMIGMLKPDSACNISPGVIEETEPNVQNEANDVVT